MQLFPPSRHDNTQGAPDDSASEPSHYYDSLAANHGAQTCLNRKDDSRFLYECGAASHRSAFTRSAPSYDPDYLSFPSSHRQLRDRGSCSSCATPQSFRFPRPSDFHASNNNLSYQPNRQLAPITLTTADLATTTLHVPKTSRTRRRRRGNNHESLTPSRELEHRTSVLSDTTKDTDFSSREMGADDLSEQKPLLLLPSEEIKELKVRSHLVLDSSKGCFTKSPRYSKNRVINTISRKSKVKAGISSKTSSSSSSSSSFQSDLQKHVYLLCLWSAIHLLALVFRVGFYPKLNQSVEFRTAAPEEAVPRYGPSDWSFYEHLTLPVSLFVKQAVVWAVIYALCLKACLWVYSINKPWLKKLLPRVYGLWCATCIGVNLSLFFYGGMESKSVFFPDLSFGTVWEFWFYDASLFSTFAPIDYALFLIGFLLDVSGLCLLIRSVRKYLYSYYDLLIPIVAVGFAIGVGVFFLAENPKCNSNDHHWINFHEYSDYVDTSMGDSPLYPPLRFPAYVAMSDGIKIAVDVYLPASYYKGFKEESMRKSPLPTYLEITRYDRRMTAIWPFSMIRVFQEPRHSSINVWSFQSVQAFLSNGYAVVVADTRGTGASEGHREVDFSAEELSDFQELIQWTKSQWWCNGKLGMGGISYDGMTGLQAASRGGVDAAMALFTPMDVIGDLLAPGGMVCSSFVRDYVGLTAKFEEEGSPLNHHLQYPWHYPFHVILGFLTTFGRALPVHRREQVAIDALTEHEKNWDMAKVVQQVEYLDDNITLMDGRELPVASFGITESIMEGLARHNVSIYIAGGYCDSAIVRGSARLYNYMKTNAPESHPKLVLGPWTHSGRRNCSPYSGSYPCYESSMYFDTVRFFDCHLKGICWGKILEEPPVSYWQVGDEAWRFSTSYPPPNLQYTELHLSGQPLGANLLPLEDGRPEELVMMNNTVIEESVIMKETRRIEDQKAEEVTLNTRKLQKPMLHQLVHDLTQMTYIRLKKPGSHKLHYYHRYAGIKVPKKLSSHQKYLAKDAYVLQPKETMLRNHTQPRPHSYSQASTVHDVVSFNVDYRATTGIFTRWLIAQHPFRMAINYGNLLFPAQANRPMRQRNNDSTNYNEESGFSSRLSFTAAPLETSLRVVGSPWVKFTAYVSGCTELSVFVYLEDLDLENGYSHYVTEGKVVASHRETMKEGDVSGIIGHPDVVYRSFSRKHYSPVQGSELVEISLTLEPVSWTFQKGHALRISMAGADVDNFELRDHAGILPVLPDKWQIIVNDPHNFPAWIKLPTDS